MSLQKDKLKLAILGAGNIARFHVQGVLDHADKLECVALCDVSDANLALRARQLGNDPALYHDLDTLFAEQDDLDAVVIALPHALHAPAILAAAAAGKHILCEKPMCTTLGEADAILEAVARSGVTYMSAHNQLFTPVVREAKRLLDKGLIGNLRWLRTQDAFVVDPELMRGTWRGASPRRGWRADRHRLPPVVPAALLRRRAGGRGARHDEPLSHEHRR